MRSNDEMTSAQIQKKLTKRGVAVSSSTVRRSRKQQGWTLQRTAYCQLIRDANKVKRLEYAQRIMESGDTFHKVLYISQNFIIARFAAFERNKLHQILMMVSISPKRLTNAFWSFFFSRFLVFSLILSFVGCSYIPKGTFF